MVEPSDATLQFMQSLANANKQSILNKGGARQSISMEYGLKRKQLSIETVDAAKAKEYSESSIQEENLECSQTPTVDTNPFFTHFGSTLFFFHDIKEIDELYNGDDVVLEEGIQKTEETIDMKVRSYKKHKKY